MMSRFLLLCDRLFSDRCVKRHEVDGDLALRQALLLFSPLVILGIGIMAVLP